MPHIIYPQDRAEALKSGRELNLVNAAKNFWNLEPSPNFSALFPDIFANGVVRVALLHKENRAGRGFSPDIIGAAGVPIGPNGAVDARNISLQLSFAMHPQFADVLAHFDALGIVRIPHNQYPGLYTSPCAGRPFYGTTPADYQHQVMTLPAMLEFFKDRGFVINIDTGYHQEKGPVQNGIPQAVWDAICAL
jgi:hypothetical protein